jgi:cysteine desulfurase / selenocysteine lyase
VIYLDNAATSWPKPDAVAAAVASALADAGNPGRGAHGPALGAGRVLWRTRSAASRLFGVRADQVVLTHSATHSLNIAIAGLLEPGDHAVTTDLEHNSVLRPLYAARARGVELTIVASRRGVIAPDAVAAALRPKTRVVALTHASNVLGTVQPLAAIAELCADKGVLLVVDAAQTAGALPLDLAILPAAAVACGGHKALLGPAGTGLLVLRDGVRPRPLEVGGTGADTFNESMPDALPEGLEAGTPNVPGIAGLGAGLEAVLAAGAADRPSDHWAIAMARAQQLRDGLAASGCFVAPEVDSWGVPVVGGNIADRTGGVLDSAEAADALAERGIAVRGGFHCAPLLHRRYGTASGMVRFSPGHLTTPAEIEATIAAVAAIAGA